MKFEVIKGKEIQYKNDILYIRSQNSSDARWHRGVMLKCIECNADFAQYKKEVNGEGRAGRTCSRACGALITNRNRKEFDLTCVICGDTFKSKQPQAKYCKTSCKRHQKALKSKAWQKEKGNNRYHLSAKIRGKHGRLGCFYKECGCNWDSYFLEKHDLVCDVHHIKEKQHGGDDDFSNLTICCPNAHKMIHNGIITQDEIITLKQYLTEKPTFAKNYNPYDKRRNF